MLESGEHCYIKAINNNNNKNKSAFDSCKKRAMRAAISVMQSTSMRSRTRLERVAEVCVPALPHEPTSSCSSLIKSDQHGCTTPQRTETRSQKKKEKKKEKKDFLLHEPRLNEYKAIGI